MNEREISYINKCFDQAFERSYHYEKHMLLDSAKMDRITDLREQLKWTKSHFETYTGRLKNPERYDERSTLKQLRFVIILLKKFTALND